MLSDFIMLPGWLQNPFLQIAAILVLGLAAAAVVHLFLNIIVRRWTQKTKTDIDDIILHICIKPTYVLIIIAALHVSLKVVETVFKGFLWIDEIFFIIYTLIISYTVTKILSLLIARWFQHHKQVEKTPQLPGRIVGAIVFVIALIIILKRLNVEITPFIATLGIGGLAVGLALQNTLSNLFAGMHLISDEPVKVGDFIELDGNPPISGTVEDIGWRSTRIKTPGNNIVVVPNAKLADSVITNDTMYNKEMSVAVRVSVSYESDLDEVERITVDVARHIQQSVPGAVASHEPLVRFHTFNESNIDCNVILRARDFDARPLIIHQFIKDIKKAYGREGITMSYPTRVIYSKQQQKPSKGLASHARTIRASSPKKAKPKSR